MSLFDYQYANAEIGDCFCGPEEAFIITGTMHEEGGYICLLVTDQKIKMSVFRSFQDEDNDVIPIPRQQFDEIYDRISAALQDQRRMS